jgi:tetraacyldisaccharide 4'-kinase
VSSEDLGDSLLPAGNLRAPRGALRRATAFAVLGGDDAAAEALAGMNAADAVERPMWRYSRRMSAPAVAGPVVAFCGIARPEQFFAGLEAAGVAVAGRRVFPDHHRFTERDAGELATLARSVGAQAFVTTGKDRVRLGGLGASLSAVAPVAVAGLTVELAEPDAVALWLLRQASAGTP